MCRNLLPQKITAGTVLINAGFLLLKTQSLSAGGGEEEEGKLEKHRVEKREKRRSGIKKIWTEQIILETFEPTKWFHLQT